MRSSSFRELAVLLCREVELLHRLASESVTPGGLDELAMSIRTLELHRALKARELTLALGREGELRLTELIRAAPPEEAETLSGHQRELVRLLAAHRVPPRSLRDFVA